MSQRVATNSARTMRKFISSPLERPSMMDLRDQQDFSGPMGSLGGRADDTVDISGALAQSNDTILRSNNIN